MKDKITLQLTRSQIDTIWRCLDYQEKNLAPLGLSTTTRSREGFACGIAYREVADTLEVITKALSEC